MPPKKQSIYDIYFAITQEYIDKYGPHTILLYQVGAFFEIYGVQDPTTGNISKSQIEEITQLSQLNMSAKEIETPEGHILMAGFRDYSLEKYLKVITANGYTAVVYTQNMTNPKAITRELFGIYSAGTLISYDTDSSQQLSNHIICIWLSTHTPFRSTTPQFVCGISSAHIFTGESTMFEYDAPFIMNPTTFDELERYVSTIAPSEAIVISYLSDKQTTQILQYSGLKTLAVHTILMQTETNLQKIAMVENCQKQKYISHMLSTFFGEDAFSVCKEFHTYMVATQSFCFLTNFLQEHNPDLVKKISVPHFQNSIRRMVLANHTLKQLNIIDDDSADGKTSGKLSSVSSFLNKCCNPMGRRVFHKQIVLPVFDTTWIQKEYDMVEHFMKRDDIPNIRKGLHKIRDLEKICRQIIVKKVYPHTIFQFYESICQISQLQSTICDPVLTDYLYSEPNIAEELAAYMDSQLIMEKCKGVESTSFSENIIQPGVDQTLDALIQQYKHNMILFDTIRNTLNKMLRTYERKTEETEYIKVHETDKSGATLQITKKRGELLRSIFTTTHITFTEELVVPTKDIRFVKASGSNDEIEFPQLTTILKQLLVLKEKISVEISRVFLAFLMTLEKDWYDKIEQLIQWTIRIDILQSKSYMALENKYCKPVIDASSKKSFFSAKGMRHVLIEHLQQNETYVPNDLELSRSQYDSILLFGTNAVGKTSFIRAIGICIIMAQAGMFVPCAEFVFCPYTAIFSRILGNDNIFKGLSTFAVEMSELRIILKHADENSLVLGDELCSGTEMESALSLFSAGLVELSKKRATFLFATHFHEITQYDEIRALTRMALKHMSVQYDPSLQQLVYDRLLKDGQGSRMYGLEVCKSLYMEPAFLERAYEFRNKYFPEQRGELGFKTSTYNAKKIRGKCEMCHKEIADEVHHLAAQQLADSTGHIGGTHKNHLGNLAAVCESCHLSIHANDLQLVKKKTTKGYVIRPL